MIAMQGTYTADAREISEQDFLNEVGKFCEVLRVICDSSDFRYVALDTDCDL